jgi:uncharacterized ferritin-like protein (DUF455 family)
MYKIKAKYINLVSKNAWTKLDVNGVYNLETWIKAGFKQHILELIN